VSGPGCTTPPSYTNGFDRLSERTHLAAVGARDFADATLKMTHKAIGVEVRRGMYDIVVDGQRAGSLEMNDTIQIPVEPGRHTLQIRSGRNSSRTQTFEAAESQTVAFRCTGKSFLPIFLASFVVPSLALQLRREADDRSL
jgi:hypothetical protein